MSYLIHHGIKGMKWGVRRYQNPDGTLTEAGKKRYDQVTKTYYGHTRDIDNEEKYRKERDIALEPYKKVSAKIDSEIREERDKVYGKYWDKASQSKNKFVKRHYLDKYYRLQQEARKKVNDRHKDELIEADNIFKDFYNRKVIEAERRTLKDIGFEDTEEGRQFVRDVLDTSVAYAPDGKYWYNIKAFKEKYEKDD